MKKCLQYFGIVLILALILAGCGNSSSETDSSEANENGTSNSGDSFKIRIGHALSETHSQHKTFEAFKEYVEEQSEGQLTVEIFPNGQIGNDRELIEGIQVGTVTMAAPSTAPISGFIPEFSVFDLPFLFANRDVAYSVLDGEIGTSTLQKLESIGIKGLGYWENGYRHLTNSRNAVRSPEDVKGMVIRTMENSMHVSTWELLGANPTPMAWADVFVSLQQGTLDGQENPLSTIYSQSVYEVQDYLTLTGHVYSPFAVLMNKDFYDSLPDNLRAIVDSGVEAATIENRRLVVEEEIETLGLLEEAGKEIVQLSPEEIQAFQEATLSIYDNYKAAIGEELVDQILEAVR